MGAVGAYIAILRFPEPLFAYRRQVGEFVIFADRPIPAAVDGLMADVRARLATSEIYVPGVERKIFFCHDNWRFALLSEQFSSHMGGVADTTLTGNVYLGHADIAANALRLPDVPAARLRDRPLAYFVAHELTHQMEADAFGGPLKLRHPFWLVEGYADQVGKAGVIQAAMDRTLLLADHRDLDPDRSHIYRLYQLEVWALIHCRGRSVESLFQNPPDEVEILTWLRSPAAERCVAAPST